MNLIVGANNSGKSTLLEAIVLALTNRLNGRSAIEELNPYWFNTTLVAEFLKNRLEGIRSEWPRIKIELFLENRDDLQQLCGANNSEIPTIACPGVSLEVSTNSNYTADLEEWLKTPSPLLPVEYYKVEWRSFSGEIITNRPKQLATAIIDSRTVRSSSGIDLHLRYILNESLLPTERAAISVAYRGLKSKMSEETLRSINTRMSALHKTLHDQPIELAIDQSYRTSWEGVVTPHVNEIPFSMSGQGQQAAIKISLAMNHNSTRATFVLVEEPENHLTHTSLRTLLTRMEGLKGESQQIFIATHSSFVANHLGLNCIHLLSNNKPCKITELNLDTVKYFQKLPGYDTLRLVLANKVVLVEGPSDEIIFERIFRDLFGKSPMDAGIDVLSMRGLTLRRSLELCSILDKKVAAIRDNDSQDPDSLRESLKTLLSYGKRELFVGAIDDGVTLEPQLIRFNGEAKIKKILNLKEEINLEEWMKREKTEAALRIADTKESINPPQYMMDAAKFING